MVLELGTALGLLDVKLMVMNLECLMEMSDDSLNL
jgi:hypothetical protein